MRISEEFYENNKDLSNEEFIELVNKKSKSRKNHYCDEDGDASNDDFQNCHFE
jgi:hypothetical protein